MSKVATIDFHVTSECTQECPYCWGSQNIEAVDTDTALAILIKIAACGAHRVVFTGGDPLKRQDIGALLHFAKEVGLETALSTTGDLLTQAFLESYASFIDLVSLPLEGASEEVSSRTKKAGHFTAIMKALDMLAKYPQVDVKVCTPVTRFNLEDVPNIARLLDEHPMPNRMFYNVFQAFPRSMSNIVAWDELVISDAEFAALREQVEAQPHAYRINWLDHATLDKLYVMIFPDGTLTVPCGGAYLNYGSFLAIPDLDALLEQTDFDALKHLRHAQGWGKAAVPTAK